MNKKLTQLSAALLLALPIASFAQAHGGGGGPPAGIGGGVSGAVGGATGGMGHAGGIAGGIGGSASAAGGSHASDLTSLSDTGMSKAEAHRLELKAKKDAAAAKAADAQSQGAAHANANAAFGQSTAATARTLKNADPATRAAFHDTVTAGAKLQGKGDGSGDDTAEGTDTDSDSSGATSLGASDSAKGSALVGANHANAHAQFGQDTAAQARTLKDADAATRQAFGGTVSARAKAKPKSHTNASPSQ